MANANVLTLLLKNAWRGTFLLGESSFGVSRTWQKHCILLEHSDSRLKGERRCDDTALPWPVVMVKLVIATLCAPWAVAALYKQCSCGLFHFIMIV
jgi:hypothetical protein